MFRPRPSFPPSDSTPGVADAGPSSSNASTRPTPGVPAPLSPLRRDHEDRRLHRSSAGRGHPHDPRTLRPLARPTATPGGTPPQAARPSRSARLAPEPEPGIIAYEVDPDFLEHAHREETSGGISGGDQPELPWES